MTLDDPAGTESSAVAGALEALDLAIDELHRASTPLHQISAASLLEAAASRYIYEVVADNPQLTWQEVGRVMLKQMDSSGRASPYGNRQGPRQRLKDHPIVKAGRARSEVARLRSRRAQIVLDQQEIERRRLDLQRPEPAQAAPTVLDRYRHYEGEFLDSPEACAAAVARLRTVDARLSIAIAEQIALAESSEVRPLDARTLRVERLREGLAQRDLVITAPAEDRVVNSCGDFQAIDAFVSHATPAVSWAREVQVGDVDRVGRQLLDRLSAVVGADAPERLASQAAIARRLRRGAV